MAIVLSSQTTGQSSGAGPYATASVTGTNNELWMAVCGGVGFSAITTHFSISGDGFSFASISQRVNAASNTDVIELLATLVPSGAATGALSITPPQSMSNCFWSVFKASGIDSTGVNGANAIYQSVASDGRDSGTAASFGSSLGTLFDATNDVTMMACYASSGANITIVANQTALTTPIQGAGTGDNMGVESSSSPPTVSPSFQSTGNFEYLTWITWELKVPGGGGGSVQVPHMDYGFQPRVASVSSIPDERVRRRWRAELAARRASERRALEETLGRRAA